MTTLRRVTTIALSTWLVLVLMPAAPVPIQPLEAALAADATVAVCNEEGFETALDAVQATGGGTLTFSCAGRITFTSAKVITANVTIDGGDVVTLDGAFTDRLLTVASTGRLTVDSLTLQNGEVGFQRAGGAIWSSTPLTVIDSTFLDNTADDGGAIYNASSTTIVGSTFRGNLATSDQAAFGGAIFGGGPVSISSSEFVENSADGGQGGAVYMDDNHLGVTDSTFTGNSAGLGGALLFETGASLFVSGSTFTENSATVGGALTFGAATAATIVASSFDMNSTSSGGGAIQNFSDGDITIIESTLTNNTASGNGGAAIIGSNGGAFRLINSTVSGNSADEDGGALWGGQAALSIIASILDGNSSGGSGGALADRISGGSRTIRDSTISNNSAVVSGGAIYNQTHDASISDSTFSGNTTEGNGGALDNDGGIFAVSRSTFAGNMADGNGGAIYTDTTIEHDVTASTFTGNSATNGGAIWGRFDGVGIVASTFNGNSATNSGGALFTEWGGISSQTSIVAGNTAPTGPNCFRQSVVGMGGVIFSGGYNVSNDATCGFTEMGDIENSAAAGVASLADNGGPTETMLPTGADTLDNADCTLSSPEDQRGVTRPATDCDRGATESAGTVPVQIFAFYNADGIAYEGSPVTLAVVADGPAGASLDYDFDCDDDDSYETQGVEDGNSGSAACTFPDNGPFDVNVQVCDGANCDSDTLSVSVNNVAPTITDVSNDGPVDEGSPVTITVTATDPAGVNDPLTVSADCDDSGDFETAGGATTVQCTFAEGGMYTVPVRVEDGDGGSATASTEVTVNNADPVISSVTNDGPIDEPGTVTVTVTATDPGGVNDPLMYEFDCGSDGTYEIGPQAANSAMCSFDDNGNFTVPVRVTDDDGGAAEDSTVVTVNNLDPTITAATDNGPVDEGSPATVTVTATDPAGVNDPLMYAFDCDNDSVYEIGPQAANTVQCTYSDDGPMIVPVRVTDDDGGAATASTTVTINNGAPTVDAPVVDIEPSHEDQEVVASATFSDPGTDDTHTCTVNYGDGGGPQDGTVDGLTCTGPPHTYLDDDPSGTPSDPYTITIVVTDDDNGSGDNSAVHTVNNVAPTIDGITTNSPVPQGQPVAVTVAASDVGVNDTLTYRFDCNNDGSYELGPQPDSTANCVLDPAAATTTITVEVSDDDGGTDTGSVVVGQQVTLCAHYATATVTATGAGGQCNGGTVALSLPGPFPVTFCIHPHTGGLRLTAAGCASLEHPHVVPGDGALHYCVHTWLNRLRIPPLPGQCNANELPGVIPG